MDKLEPIKIDRNTFLRQHCTLPALPSILTKIQNNIHSDDFSIKDASDLISSDPSLVAQILKVANSAYYGFPREISDAKFAIAYLGINEVYRIVLTVSVVNTLNI